MVGRLGEDEAGELEGGEEQVRVGLWVGEDLDGGGEGGLGCVEEERGRGLEREVGEVEAGLADRGRVDGCDEGDEAEVPAVEERAVEALVVLCELEDALRREERGEVREVGGDEVVGCEQGGERVLECLSGHGHSWCSWLDREGAGRQGGEGEGAERDEDELVVATSSVEPLLSLPPSRSTPL